LQLLLVSPLVLPFLEDNMRGLVFLEVAMTVVAKKRLNE
jgi:hypothetical protein